MNALQELAFDFGKQEPNDVAAVMETLVDDAHRAGMTEQAFKDTVRKQFRLASQGASPELTTRLREARDEIGERTEARYAELAVSNTRHMQLGNLEEALQGMVRPSTDRLGRSGSSLRR